MKCCLCGQPIRKRDGRTYWHEKGRKRYACWTCNENGKVDQYLDSLSCTEATNETKTTSETGKSA
jgi:hypothetical protein